MGTLAVVQGQLGMLREDQELDRQFVQREDRP